MSAIDWESSPAQLNVLVPEWTQKVVERIFASHLEDWPALLKSLRSVGDEVRGQSAQAVTRSGNRVMTCEKRGKRLYLPVLLPALLATTGTGIWLVAQEPTPVFKAKVDLVVLSFTVTDNKGKYVNGLKPSDFKVTEDGISEKLATFSEGSRPAMQILADGTMKPLLPDAPEAEKIGAAQADQKGGDAFVGTNVFVLFDTSNFMYRGFVYAEDAIADFVRGLDKADSVAVYTFSRNLSRAASLTHDRNDAILGLRKAVAGDDTALYNGLLLTLRDAAKVPGRKVVIVFSNGPDNASMVAPDDVRAVAEDEGIPIYVISTNDVNKDPISSECVQAHRTAYRRQSLLGENVAETGGSVRSDPRGSGQFLYGDLLPGA